MVALVYNTAKWKEVENMQKNGCMVLSDRPYILQLFESKDSDGTQLIVMGAHYDHLLGVGDLTSDMQALQAASQVTRIVLIADTNRFVGGGVTPQSDHFCDISKQPNSTVVCQTNAEIL